MLGSPSAVSAHAHWLPLELIARIFRQTPATASASSGAISSSIVGAGSSSSIWVSPESVWRLSRCLGLSAHFHLRLLHLLDLGFKCRLRLPLFISAGFALGHLAANYVPRVEFNLQLEELTDDEAEAGEDDLEAADDRDSVAEDEFDVEYEPRDG